MPLDLDDLPDVLTRAGLCGRPVCLHASLSSFGWVEGGAGTVVDAFLDGGRTLLVPTFSWKAFAVTPPPLGLRPPRNGTDYENLPIKESLRVFSPTEDDVDKAMGAIAAEVLSRRERRRGNHPLCSFAAIGPESTRLTNSQTLTNVYAPLKVLAELGGVVVLAGVGLDRMTLLHLAEEIAGRSLFRRWARIATGDVVMVSVGGCSGGFRRFDETLEPIETRLRLGGSTWRIFAAQAALEIAAAAMAWDPGMTRCGAPGCERCRDAVLGGQCCKDSLGRAGGRTNAPLCPSRSKFASESSLAGGLPGSK